MRPRLIGIAGPSCSGKTSLARCFVEQRPQSCRIPLDAYYLDHPGLSLAERAAQNFDHPDSLDHELLAEQIARLAGGQTIDLPHYSFETHERTVSQTALAPESYVIVEGLYALYWRDVRERLDLKVFVDADDETCLARRLSRDVHERGRTPESVREQYARFVRPMAEKFLRPTRHHADLLLSGTEPLERNLERLLELAL